MIKVNKCPTSLNGNIPRSYTVGQVLSINKTDSAPINVENAIALNNRRFVLNLIYAEIASMEINTASVIPPICKKIWAIWYPWNRCGIIIGKANVTITPVTTIENNVDFLSTRVSALNNVIRLSNCPNLNTTGSNFE